MGPNMLQVFSVTKLHGSVPFSQEQHLWTHLLSEQLVVDSETIERVDIFPQLQVALSELLDVLAGFGQDSSFTLKQTGSEA